MEFSGAMMTISKPKSWKQKTYNMVPWDKAVYNTSGYWDAKNPTRLTIPKGVTKVKLSANIIWTTVGTTFQQGYRMIRMRKNGEYTTGLPYSRYMGVSTSPSNAVSSVVEVKEGDYFELEVYYREDTPLELRADPYTWFSIEAVEFEKKSEEPSFMLIGHRGATGYTDEHTIKGYQMALDLGADYIELDLQLTKDKKLLCIHDSTLDRTTTGKGNVSDYTLAEIQSKFKSNNGERIPSLQDVLEHFGEGAKYYIETKKPFNKDMDLELLKQLRSYNLIGDGTPKYNVIIQSFAKESLQNIRNHYSNIPLVYLTKTFTDSIVNECVTEGFYAIAPTQSTITAERVSYAHSKKLKVHTWTVNTREDMKFVISSGVDGLFTNFIKEYLSLQKS